MTPERQITVVDGLETFKQHVTIKCDGCGILFDSREDSRWFNVRSQAREAGWTTVDNDHPFADEDYCPECS